MSGATSRVTVHSAQPCGGRALRTTGIAAGVGGVVVSMLVALLLPVRAMAIPHGPGEEPIKVKMIISVSGEGGGNYVIGPSEANAELSIKAKVGSTVTVSSGSTDTDDVLNGTQGPVSQSHLLTASWNLKGQQVQDDPQGYTPPQHQVQLEEGDLGDTVVITLSMSDDRTLYNDSNDPTATLNILVVGVTINLPVTLFGRGDQTHDPPDSTHFSATGTPGPGTYTWSSAAGIFDGDRDGHFGEEGDNVIVVDQGGSGCTMPFRATSIGEDVPVTVQYTYENITISDSDEVTVVGVEIADHNEMEYIGVEEEMSFSASPAGPSPGTYLWSISGEEGVDYEFVAGSATTQNITVKFLTPGSKTVDVQYTYTEPEPDKTESSTRQDIEDEDEDGETNDFIPDPSSLISVDVDLDIVGFSDDGEYVAEDDEEEGSRGACLSLNRGAGHLRRILIRDVLPGNLQVGQVRLEWTSAKIEVYENADKTGNIGSGETFDLDELSKPLYVEGVEVSGSKGQERVTAKYVPVPGAGDPVGDDTIAFTNFEVEITLRDGSGGQTQFSPLAEFDKRDNMIALLDGQNKLGLVDYRPYSAGPYRYYGGSIEVVGQLKPNDLREDDFYGDEFYWRQNFSVYYWRDDNGPDKLAEDDTDDPDAIWQDRTPSATGRIYYPDVPSMRPTPDLADLNARRDTYLVWCTFKYHDEPMGCNCPDTDECEHIQKRNANPTSGYRICSTADKNYYFRVTLRQTGTGGLVNDKRDDESCTHGNEFGEAIQAPNPMHYDLKAPTVASITPNSGARGNVIGITDLAGTVFVKGLTVELMKQGQGNMTATNVNVETKNKIKCEFDIPAEAAVGDWSVKVTNPAVDNDGDGNKEAAKSSNTDKTFEVTE